MGRPLPGQSSPEGKDVTLGMPGAWADAINELADHYTTKVGGQPDWPDPLKPLIKCDQLKCAVCGGYLGLVAQVHAPLTSDGLNFPERTIYILGCPAQGCGISPISWRTIRVQRNTSEVENNADSNNSYAPAGPIPIDFEWRATSSRQGRTTREERDEWWDDNLWNGAPAGESSVGEVDSMNFHELQSSLTEAARLAATVSGSQNSSNTSRIIGGQRNTGTSISRGPNQNLPVLPCFYIYSQAESAESSTGSGPSPSDTDPQAGMLAVGENDNPSIGGEDAGEIWASEEYEHDHALHADRTYLKFKRKLDCFPEQCFRYSFAGEPLWAIDEHMDAANCASCGGPLVFEMQLMPPLLYYLQQAHKDLPPSIYGPDEWDWHTLMVFSCAQSCVQEESQQLLMLGEKTDWSFIEEATILQQDLSAAFIS